MSHCILKLSEPQKEQRLKLDFENSFYFMFYFKVIIAIYFTIDINSMKNSIIQLSNSN